jgi:hypothetical protein
MKIPRTAAFLVIACGSTLLAQSGPDPCIGALSASPASLLYNANGGPLTTFTVTAAAGCNWFFSYKSGDGVIMAQNYQMGSVTFDSSNPLLGIINHLPRVRTEQFVIASSAGTVASGIITATQDPAFNVTTSCPVNSRTGLPTCNGSVGAPFSASVTASGGKPPYIYSTDQNHFPNTTVPDRNLPAGLTLNPSTGAISGTPAPNASSTLPTPVWVKDADGAINAIGVYIIIGGACTSSIDGPADVPGLSSYNYAIHLAAGQTASGISWTVDQPTASFAGSTNQPTATVQFQNTKADYVTLQANFTANGSNQCATKQVALVKVDVAKANFTAPGKALGSGGGSSVFLVNPPIPPGLYIPAPGCAGLVKPLPPPGAFWVTALTPTTADPDPGKDTACFIYNGTSQAAEPRKFIDSAAQGGPAFQAQVAVTLTSPAAKPTAQQRIQIGFIQSITHSGNALFPQNLTRVITTPSSTTVDWLSNPQSPGDLWPWYDSGHFPNCPANADSTETGSGNAVWNGTLCMNDSPARPIPAHYNFNDPKEQFGRVGLISARDNFVAVIRVGVRTLDNDLAADTHYFDEANSNWRLNYHWPVAAGVSAVVLGPDWTRPPSPSEITVNVVPSITNHKAPFMRWRCASASCGP